MRVMLANQAPPPPQEPSSRIALTPYGQLEHWIATAREALPRISVLRLVAVACFALGLLALARASLRVAPPSVLVAGVMLILAAIAVFQLDREREHVRARKRARLIELQIRLKLVRRSLQVALATATQGSQHEWAVASTGRVQALQEQMIRVSTLGSQDGRWLTARTSAALDAFLEVADRWNELASRPESVVQFAHVDDADLAQDAARRLRTALDAMDDLIRRADEVA